MALQNSKLKSLKDRLNQEALEGAKKEVKKETLPQEKVAKKKKSK